MDACSQHKYKYADNNAVVDAHGESDIYRDSYKYTGNTADRDEHDGDTADGDEYDGCAADGDGYGGDTADSDKHPDPAYGHGYIYRHAHRYFYKYIYGYADTHADTHGYAYAVDKPVDIGGVPDTAGNGSGGAAIDGNIDGAKQRVN